MKAWSSVKASAAKQRVANAQASTSATTPSTAARASVARPTWASSASAANPSPKPDGGVASARRKRWACRPAARKFNATNVRSAR